MQTKLVELLDVDTTTAKTNTQGTDTENTSFKSTKRIKIISECEASNPIFPGSINANNINVGINSSGLNSFLKIPLKTNGNSNGSGGGGINVEEYCRRSIMKETEKVKKLNKSNNEQVVADEALSNRNGVDKKPDFLSETLLNIVVMNSDYHTLM